MVDVTQRHWPFENVQFSRTPGFTPRNISYNYDIVLPSKTSFFIAPLTHYQWLDNCMVSVMHLLFNLQFLYPCWCRCIIYRFTPRSGPDWVLWYSGGDVTLVQPNFELRQHNELLLHVLTKHCYAPLPPSSADRGLMVDRWGYILASLYHCNKSVVSIKIFSTIVTVHVNEDVVVARIKRW